MCPQIPVYGRGKERERKRRRRDWGGTTTAVWSVACVRY
jgi:hypothetical protein